MYFKENVLLLLFAVLLGVNALRIQKRLRSTKVIDIELANYHGSLYINNRYRCAATLISEDKLLSVAHHVDDIVAVRPPSAVDAVILLGASNLTEGGTIYPVKRISHHKGFSRSSPFIFPDDIAVIHLLTKIEESRQIRPARLIDEDKSVPNKLLVHVTGYGLSRPTSVVAELLRVQVTISSLRDCQISFPYGTLNNTSHMCGFTSENNGCTVGDGGAPVYAFRQRYLVGIVSYDTWDGLNGHPMIFTNLSNYLDYIESELYDYTSNEEDREHHPAIDFQLEEIS